VLVEAIATFGVAGALARAKRPVRLAAFDRATRTLHLARDRLGIKPLYWTRQNGAFAFASELKALRALDGLAFELDPGALAAYLALLPACRRPARSFAMSPKLAPGHRLEASAAGVTVRRYWDVAEIARRGQQALDQRPEIGDRRGAARPASRCGRAADGVGRAARRLPVGRHRFVDGGRVDAAGGEPSG